MTDLIIVAILVVICGGAVGYIYKAKKNGAKCIGCPAGGSGGCCCCAHNQSGSLNCCAYVTEKE